MPASEYKRWKPVEVLWYDAVGSDGAWEPWNNKMHTGQQVRSVGMMVRHTRRGVTLVLSAGQDTGGDERTDINGRIFIPNGMLESVTELRAVS